MKKIVDERQELELMRVERLGFWVLYAAIAVDIIAKILFLGISPKDLLGETASFALGSLVIFIGCIRRGLWTYHSIPTLKGHLLYSAIFSIIFGVLFYIAVSSGAAAFAFTIFIFIIMFVILFIMGKYTLKRQEKLNNEYDEND